MIKEQTIIASQFVTSECVAEMINIVDTSATSQKLLHRLDHELHQNLQYLKQPETYSIFLTALRDSLEAHDIPLEKLKTINYHLLAIDLADKLRSLREFHHSDFIEDINSMLIKNKCTNIQDQVWVLNKVIFYTNSQPLEDIMSLTALRALEQFKTSLKDQAQDYPSGRFVSAKNETFIDRWQVIYDEVINLFRLR